LPFKRYFGETDIIALKDNSSLKDLSRISKKHFQFLKIIIPGHESQQPTINPVIKHKKFFIKIFIK
tara:strand:+ start:1195 stop:1392 length:198 start_codon:yes stop_codon:yes gene_type:complete